MAFSSQNPDSGGDGGNDFPQLAEINIIPLVDVMLVLLIITMVTAPFLEQGINVELPVTEGKNLQKDTIQSEPLVLFISRDEILKLGEQTVSKNDLIQVILKKMASRKDKEIFVRADKKVPYGVVADIMARIQGAGIERVGLVTQSE